MIFELNLTKKKNLEQSSMLLVVLNILIRMGGGSIYTMNTNNYPWA